MTDSMKFGPDWIRYMSSEGRTGGGTAGGVKYQLAEYRYVHYYYKKQRNTVGSISKKKCCQNFIDGKK